MRGYNLLINGELVLGASTMPVLNPATEEVLADCPRSSEEQLNEAVQAAKEAFSSWSQTKIDTVPSDCMLAAGKPKGWSCCDSWG